MNTTPPDRSTHSGAAELESRLLAGDFDALFVDDRSPRLAELADELAALSADALSNEAATKDNIRRTIREALGP